MGQKRYTLEEHILYEDEEIMVCQKAAGVPVQSARFGSMDMEHMVLNYLAIRQEQQNQKIRQKPYVGVIHRLDQPVEGIVVFAKTPSAAKALSMQIANGKMKKCYLAVSTIQKDVLAVTQQLSQEVAVDDYLYKDGRSNTSKVVYENHPQAKKARLSYKIIQVKEQLALIQIQLDTGRHHQIRVQMANQKLPLWGDSKYNSNSIRSGEWKDIALCANQLTFTHPSTKKKMIFQINPLGEIFHTFSIVS